MLHTPINNWSILNLVQGAVLDTLRNFCKNFSISYYIVDVVGLSHHAWLSKYKELAQTGLTMGCDNQLILLLFM